MSDKCTHHVVFEAKDSVVNVELRQLFLMNADLVLLLDLNDPGLNFLPRCIWELRLKCKRTINVTGQALMCVTIINVAGCI